MATWKEQQMKMQEKLQAIRRQIDELRIQERLLVELLGETVPKQELKTRQRSPGIKPLVLDYMTTAAEKGATSKEVDDAIRSKVPMVGSETVGSVLSRLKGDGALTYDGERYFVKGQTAARRPFDAGIHAVK